MVKKILFLQIVFVLMLHGIGCVSENSASSSEREDYAVYNSLIKHEFFRGKPNARKFEILAICDRTIPVNEKEISNANKELFLNDEIIENFKMKSVQTVPLKDLFLFSQPHQLIDERIPKIGCGKKNFWEDFYKQYPKSQGIIWLSRIGFNRDRNKALVYIESMSGDLWGYGHFVFLEKKWGRWKIVASAGHWVS